MFERLIDLLLQTWDQLNPVFVVDAYQHAGVLRFGKFIRTCEPGLHWKIPFAERAIEVETCVTTMRLPPQTLTTLDGKVVVVAAIVRYQIRDVKPYLTLILDQQDVLADVTMGQIRASVREQTLEQLTGEPPENKIATAVRRKVGRFGFDVEAVTFTDLAAVRSFRLIQPNPKDLYN